VAADIAVAVEDFVAAVVEDFDVEAVAASVVVVLAVLAASVSAVSALALVLAVSVSFNCYGSLSRYTPITFPKEKINNVNQKCPCVIFPQGHFLNLRLY
jgi:type III secretory pathway component EscU